MKGAKLCCTNTGIIVPDEIPCPIVDKLIDKINLHCISLGLTSNIQCGLGVTRLAKMFCIKLMEHSIIFRGREAHLSAAGGRQFFLPPPL